MFGAESGEIENIDVAQPKNKMLSVKTVKRPFQRTVHDNRKLLGNGPKENASRNFLTGINRKPKIQASVSGKTNPFRNDDFIFNENVLSYYESKN